MLNTGFRGMPIAWKCIAGGNNDDGRWLYEIEVGTKEHKEVILEGLQLWGVHLKTLESAKVLAQKLLYSTDVSIKGDKLVIVNPDAADLVDQLNLKGSKLLTANGSQSLQGTLGLQINDFAKKPL